ncbi:MAG: hypothetical protein HC837_18255 [Chloroflexaceae bacterium]|nr:hypothetical protein [Chloroflexaceae bacterium]
MSTFDSVEGHVESFTLPLWSVLPFVGLLLTIGTMSFVAANYPHHRAAHVWENNNNKLIIALAWALPVLVLVAWLNAWEPLLKSLEEYFAFIVLLLSLFVISGGIHLEEDVKATPMVNTAFLAAGAALANIIGTTGASMLLIRPMLKTNAKRQYTAHIPVFFIFIVSNIAGCLLPIGDPPLFLGYLQGVPFFWTLGLILPWTVAVVMLLILFYVWDTYRYKKRRRMMSISMILHMPIRASMAASICSGWPVCWQPLSCSRRNAWNNGASRMGRSCFCASMLCLLWPASPCSPHRFHPIFAKRITLASALFWR